MNAKLTTLLGVLSLSLLPVAVRAQGGIAEPPVSAPLGDSQECRDMTTPIAGCTGVVTYTVIETAAEECEGGAKVKINVKINCASSSCNKNYTSCASGSGSINFRCDGNGYKLSLGSGTTYGDMATGEAACSSGSLGGS